MKKSISHLQKKILKVTKEFYGTKKIDYQVEVAFLETPRHLFVSRYKSSSEEEWIDVNQGNLVEHLSILYRDSSLILWREDGDKRISTISQPSLVLFMLSLLKLEPGHKVLELGAGSGWNAALMGNIVGTQGHVYSFEIIPQMAQIAAETIARLDIDNVSIIEGDAGEGFQENSPFDRIIFTAGTYDLPRNLFQQLKEGGLLLIVLKNSGGGDNLCLLQKQGECLTSLHLSSCRFVPVTGKHNPDDFEPIYLEDLSEWAELKNKEISRTKSCWGQKEINFNWHTVPICFFLSICEPCFQAFQSPKTGKNFFGIWEQEHESLAIAKGNQIITYGNSYARECLLNRIQDWVDLGMPNSNSFKLRIYPVNIFIPEQERQWIVKRRESQFVWELELNY